MNCKFRRLICVPLTLATLLGLTRASIGQKSYLLETEGVLSETDARLDDGSPYDQYFFNGEEGQLIQITLESDEFDTYLFLNDPSGTELAQNDDSEYGSNSEIVIRLPATGRYQILANTYGEDGRGSYELSIAELVGENNNAFLSYEAEEFFDIGTNLRQSDEFEQAIEAFQSALERYRTLGDYRGEANSLGSLGTAYFNLEEYEKAASFFEQSLLIERNSNNRLGEVLSLFYLASSYRMQGDYERAIDLYEVGLSMNVIQNNDSQRKADFLSGLGSAFYGAEQYRQAIDSYEQGLEVERGINNRVDEAITLNNEVDPID